MLTPAARQKNSTARWGLGGVLTSIGVFMSPPQRPANARPLIGAIVLGIGLAWAGWALWSPPAAEAPAAAY